MIPAIAMVCGMLRLRAYAPQWLAVALIAGTLAGIALGAMQVVSSSVQVSPLYLYEDTSVGRAVGFFANADHMATLLVITLPFLAATASAARGANVQRYSAVVSIAIGLAIVIGVGVALNGSLAGYVLMPPVIAGSALVVIRARRNVRVGIMVLAAVLFLGSVIAVEATAIGGERIGQHTTAAVQSRAELLSTTTRAVFDFLPWGSGLGSFQRVYPLYETPKLVTTTYVIHAHNDYVEVALELGALGIVLMTLFLAWWGAAVWRAWRTAESAPFVRAAAIASAAILAHSLVDFPLRTSAISACFGMCVALLAGGRVAAQQDGAQLRRTRHVVI
jgi:O-antigen ligase